MKQEVSVLKAEQINIPAMKRSSAAPGSVCDDLSSAKPQYSEPTYNVKANRKLVSMQDFKPVPVPPVPEKKSVAEPAENKRISILEESQIGKITHNPANVTSHSFQESISRGIGHYAICEFLMGNEQMNIREGILKEVGQSYFILYNEETDTSISCDFYSLKFVTFYRAGLRPRNGI